MITALSPTNYSYSRSRCTQGTTPFGAKIPNTSNVLKKNLQDFARDLEEGSKLSIPREMFPGVPPYVKEISIEVIKPEKGILPQANQRALALIVSSQKGSNTSKGSIWLTKGNIYELQEALRRNQTSDKITEQVPKLAREAFESSRD